MFAMYEVLHLWVYDKAEVIWGILVFTVRVSMFLLSSSYFSSCRSAAYENQALCIVHLFFIINSSLIIWLAFSLKPLMMSNDLRNIAPWAREILLNK